MSFRRAVETMDIDAVAAKLADDVVFNSPVMAHPYEGRAAVTKLFAVLAEVFEDFHYTDELVDPADPTRTWALVFRARLGTTAVQGIDLLTVRPDGAITEFTVMVRPLPAAMTLARLVGARILELERAGVGMGEGHGRAPASTAATGQPGAAARAGLPGPPGPPEHPAAAGGDAAVG
jgi:hypothetical protein